MNPAVIPYNTPFPSKPRELDISRMKKAKIAPRAPTQKKCMSKA